MALIRYRKVSLDTFLSPIVIWSLPRPTTQSNPIQSNPLFGPSLHTTPKPSQALATGALDDGHCDATVLWAPFFILTIF